MFFDADRLQLFFLAGIMFLFSALSVLYGIFLLTHPRRAEDLVRSKVKAKRKFLQGTFLNWYGEIYARLFTPMVVKYGVMVTATVSILFGCVMIFASLIGLMVALFVSHL